MKVSQKRGRVRLHLEPVEVEVLATLLVDLIEVVRATDADDPVVRRLYPSAYPDDDIAAADYRSLTEGELRDDRLGRIEACRADLAASRDVDLGDPEVAQRWIQVINDLRLALGTRLGITEDGPPDELGDPDDPETRPQVLYYWLTAVQDSVVTRLMG